MSKGRRTGQLVRFRACHGAGCGKMAPVPWYVSDWQYQLDLEDWQCHDCRKQAREESEMARAEADADAFHAWLARYSEGEDDGPAGLGIELYRKLRDAWNAAIERAATEAHLYQAHKLADAIERLESRGD
jgi:hypothetical protein